MEPKATPNATSTASQAVPQSTAQNGETDTATPREPSAPVQMIAVRRRSRRRRRSNADRAETPQRRTYMVLLCVVIILMTIAAVKPIRDGVNNWIRVISPSMAHAGISLEIVALILAGLVLLYLMPGMEDRLLRLLGIRGDKRR